METRRPVTRIGSSTADTARLKMRGRDTLHDVLGRMSFGEAFFLIATGRTADDMARKIMDAALIILMDHGITPTAIVARMVADSLPTQPQVAVAAGLTMIGDKFVGSMSSVGEYLLKGIDQPDPAAWVKQFVADAQKSRVRLAGFGHPYYRPTDPRADRLFEIAREAGVKGRFIDLIEMIGRELSAARPVTLNVTAALGAILCEIDFPPAAMRGIAVVGRAAGLVAHVEEEREEPTAAAFMDFSSTIEYRED